MLEYTAERHLIMSNTESSANLFVYYNLYFFPGTQQNAPDITIQLSLIDRMIQLQQMTGGHIYLSGSRSTHLMASPDLHLT